MFLLRVLEILGDSKDPRITQKVQKLQNLSIFSVFYKFYQLFDRFLGLEGWELSNEQNFVIQEAFFEEINAIVDETNSRIETKNEKRSKKFRVLKFLCCFWHIFDTVASLGC